MKIIEGKKTILFPFNEKDIELFMDIYNQNAGKISLGIEQEEVVAKINSGQVQIWLACTKQGKAYRKIGFVFLTDVGEHTATANGMVDKQFLKDIAKQMVEKYTYTEDAYRAFIKYCFTEMGLERLQVLILKENKLSYQICKKSGFQPEGIMRHIIKDGDKFKDVVIMSIIKSEVM